MALKEFERPYFIVGGEVGKPGKYELRSDTTVAEAVQIAGGLTQQAKHSQVVLFRRVNDDLVETRLLNLKKMLKESSLQGGCASSAGGSGVCSPEYDFENRSLPDQTFAKHVHEPHSILEKDFSDSHAQTKTQIAGENRHPRQPCGNWPWCCSASEGSSSASRGWCWRQQSCMRSWERNIRPT